MDGARVYNAAIYLGVPAKRIVQGFSSVSVCLSKGLGAPVGSVLHGSKDFIEKLDDGWFIVFVQLILYILLGLEG
jgi:threonine aldolase